MASELAVHISAALRRLLSVQTSAVLAVSGGKSPIALFQALSMQDLPWHAVQVTLVDDRCVPNNHADSNAALVRKYLLCNYAKSATFYPLIDWNDADDAPDLEAVAARATADIKGLGGIDVAVADLATSPAVSYAVKGGTLSLRDIDTAGVEPLKLEAVLPVEQGGEIRAQGTARADGIHAEMPPEAVVLARQQRADQLRRKAAEIILFAVLNRFGSHQRPIGSIE